MVGKWQRGKQERVSQLIASVDSAGIKSADLEDEFYLPQNVCGRRLILIFWKKSTLVGAQSADLIAISDVNCIGPRERKSTYKLCSTEGRDFTFEGWNGIQKMLLCAKLIYTKKKKR